MKLFIPELGTKIVLTKSWSFKLYPESRNETLWKLLGIAMPPRTIPRGDDGSMQWDHDRMERWTNVSLPRGTRLTIDRIYIRRGSKEYSSVTFLLPNQPIKGAKFKKCVRFWAKLPEINNINCTIIEPEKTDGEGSE